MNEPGIKEEEEGRAAYRAGQPPEANPYPRCTVSHACWFAGWAKEADLDPKRDH